MSREEDVPLSACGGPHASRRGLAPGELPIRIVSAVRGWINTPYHLGADIRGAGVDCGMLLVRVFVDAGAVPPFDPRPYPQDWHLHRSEERYLAIVLAHCREVAEPQPGDLALFRWGRCHAHGGIITAVAPLAIVHAFSPAGRVVEEEVGRNSLLADPARAPRFFRLRDQGCA